MKDEPKAGLQLARGILRTAVGLAFLSGIVTVPLQAQLSMGRPGFTPVPPAKTRPVPQAKPAGGSTLNADKRLAEVIQNLTPKERKRLKKALKRMSPERRAQAIDAMRREVASTPHATRITSRR
jgi:hypothetical protein